MFSLRAFMAFDSFPALSLCSDIPEWYTAVSKTTKQAPSPQVAFDHGVLSQQ